MTASRRILVAPAAMLVAAVLAAGCEPVSDASAPTQIGTSRPATDVTGLVSLNHGHVAVVTAAQIQAEQAVTIDIRGTAAHNHSLALTGTQVAQIRRGQQVVVGSSPASIGDAHVHTVTFN